MAKRRRQSRRINSPDEMSVAEYRRRYGRRSRSKYNNRKVHLDGYVFDSEMEAQRYLFLKQRLHQGELTDLRIHPTYVVFHGFVDNEGNKVPAIKHKTDFSYMLGEQKITEDVKGHETQVWKLKHKLFRKMYPGIRYRVIKQHQLTED